MRITIECESDEEFNLGLTQYMPQIGELTKGLVAVYIQRGDCKWVDAKTVNTTTANWEKEVVNIVRQNVGLMNIGVTPEVVVSGEEYLSDNAPEYLEQLITGAGIVEDRSLDMMMGERPNYLIIDDLGDSVLTEAEAKKGLEKWISKPFAQDKSQFYKRTK